MQNQYRDISQLFTKYQVDGFVNINIGSSKTLEYSPLHDEVSVDNSEEISTVITLIKDHKKAVFSIDGMDISDIESGFSQLLDWVEMGEFDTDIALADITDSVSKDFSLFDIQNVSFTQLETEFLKFKNTSFDRGVSIESFSIGVQSSHHIYLNSYGSYKQQKDASGFYYMDIFGEKNGRRDNHYVSISTKQIPVISLEQIETLKHELEQKLSVSDKKLHSGNYVVTLERDVVIDFLEIIISNMGAESIREGMSLLSKYKLGDLILSPKLTIKNNPNLLGYTGNMLFDKEGVTAREVVLFESGVLKHLFVDYKNAQKEGLEFLGNSTISNIELCVEGNKNYLEKSQFLFTHLMAFHTVDEVTGKFSLNGEGYIIENGQKKDYIKNISLSGDILSLFSSIECFGDDFKTDGNYKVPSITFYNQKII